MLCCNNGNSDTSENFSLFQILNLCEYLSEIISKYLIMFQKSEFRFRHQFSVKTAFINDSAKVSQVQWILKNLSS